MRAGMMSVFAGVVVAVVLAFAPAASAKDAGFPDLPGMSSVQRLTDTKGAATEVTTPASGPTTSHRITKPGGVPTPVSASDAKAAEAAPDENAVIRNLPAGGILPVLGAETAAAQRGSDGMLLAFALGIVVLFTRFLFRLNTLGRPA